MFRWVVRRHGMHSLRHSLATRLLEEGTPVEQIAEILGHQQVASTGAHLAVDVGWDWASRAHDVTVLDEQGAVVDRWAFSHTEASWSTKLHRLRRHGEPDELPVVIEKSSGLVVDRLLGARHPVVPVHPTSFYAARPRWGASGAKSDPGDSYKLADYLRTDGHRLRRLEPTEPGLRELQALVRQRDDQVRARTAAINQLTATLEVHWPGPRDLFCSLASPITLAFLTDYPTPNAAARLGEARMAAFCRRHSYRGIKSPAQLLARLRAAPTAPIGLPSATLASMIGVQVARCGRARCELVAQERRHAREWRAARSNRRRLLAAPGPTSNTTGEGTVAEAFAQTLTGCGSCSPSMTGRPRLLRGLLQLEDCPAGRVDHDGLSRCSLMCWSLRSGRLRRYHAS